MCFEENTGKMLGKMNATSIHTGLWDLSVVKDDLSLSGTFEKLIKTWQALLALLMQIDVRDGEEIWLYCSCMWRCLSQL